MKTEKELHQEFLKLGANRRKLTNELLALLPEIYDRKIYLKYASTIIEYSGKFGGLSKGVVIKRLRLEKYLSDKPKLKEAIKTEGIHKVALVASVATMETEEAWVDKLKNMSKNAIQELSKEVRNHDVEAQNEGFGAGGLFGGLMKADGGVSTDWQELAESSAKCKAAPLKITIEITDETAFLFLKLKKELGKNGKILSNKEAMNEILKRLTDAEFPEKFKNKKVILEDDFCEEEATKEEKRNSSEKQENVSRKMEKSQQKISRYIPVHIKKMAIIHTHGKCAYPNCGHPAEIFHHRERFSESKKRLGNAKSVSTEIQQNVDQCQKRNIHDSIIPLCKVHHEFAHNGIIAGESQNAEQWNLKIDENNLSESDISYREVRM